MTVISVMIGLLLIWWNRATRESPIAEAHKALAQGRFDDAGQTVTRVLSRDPKSVPALLIAAEVATAKKRFDEAIAYYSRIPARSRNEAVQHLDAAVQRLIGRGNFSAAEHYLKRVLEWDPENLEARHQFMYLLCVHGRQWECLPHLFGLVRRGQHNLPELVILGNTEQMLGTSPESIPETRLDETDPLLLLGRARKALRDNQPKLAEKLLRIVLARAPQLTEAHVRLGEVVLETPPQTAFLEWNQNLPEAVELHPVTWVVRGRWCQAQQQLPEAARCFWEALRRDPNHHKANYTLSQVLIALGQRETAKRFLGRAEKLGALETLLFEVLTGRHSAGHLQRIVQLMESLGRPWEARSWCHIALTEDPDLTWAKNKLGPLGDQLANDPPQVLSSANVVLHVDLSHYPLPDWKAILLADEPQRSSWDVPTHVAFRDAASSAKLNYALPFPQGNRTPRQSMPKSMTNADHEPPDARVMFSYFNGRDSNTNTTHMYEYMGGGVAVLDYDSDGWPDIYLTQGCRWPPSPGQTEHRDQLYRNTGTGRFDNVTLHTGLGDERFSQGASVGDINNDGFPDLFVANIGANRLYRNNGDGTFSDVSVSTGIEGDEWTTSALIADLNGDMMPELYAVNYLTGDDIFEQICRSKDGATGLCSPSSFAGEQDRVHLNLGDGRFEEQSQTAGIAVPDGKGLGIVAADFDASGRLSLFVANDGVPNFFFVNQSLARGKLRFQEQALQLGLAVSEEGSPQACMGVAAGDANEDGLTDLFVTNFEGESNTFYLQQPGHYFADETRAAGLRIASLPLLGFGTQFLDGELDGHLDLVIANGDVDGALPMRAQYFQNLGAGRFREFRSASLGSYFEQMHLGRGLARLDWNRDGREDVVVSHLFSPVALLTNQTRECGHFLAVRLRGVNIDRDALGTVVSIQTAGRTLVRQLTAGDGYQASNQRQLVFGVGDAVQIDKLIVRWTSGHEQSFHQLAVDREILIIEGFSKTVHLNVDY